MLYLEIYIEGDNGAAVFVFIALTSRMFIKISQQWPFSTIIKTS